MRILVVGGGGREHALAWRLGGGFDEARTNEVLCAPGNAGIEADAECVGVEADDLDGQVALAGEREVDLVVVGPEVPLAAGLADRLRAADIAVLGPSADAARTEGSKTFAKKLMDRAGIPTARWQAFDDSEKARRYAREFDGRVAVKADGLAAGKGVILAGDVAGSDEAIAALMEKGGVGAAGRRVVVEELLEGQEASFIIISDGERVLPLIASQDHKAAFDGDTGPNTGGMGAVCPTPAVPAEVAQRVVAEIMEPAIATLAEMGCPFRGVLYAGLMMTSDGPKVLEFNARFGDPETQPLMMCVAGDIAPVFLAAARGDLGGHTLGWEERAAVCVVLASEGYPGSYPAGRNIEGLAELESEPDVKVFHAGTRREGPGFVTAGGRVLGVTALGADAAAARQRAYKATARVSFEGMHLRRDIGAKAVGR